LPRCGARPTGASALRGGATFAACLVVAACASFGGIRPQERPIEGAVQLTVQPAPVPLVMALDSVVRARGLAVAAEAPSEGYLETRWFDLEARRSVPDPFGNFDRIVKLRFRVDPVQGKTRVIAECVLRTAWDPSVPERELERMAPEGHAGRVLLEEILRQAGAVPYVAPATTPAS